MKKTVKKLVLAKETLRNLAKGELGRVAGASDEYSYCYCTYNFTCSNDSNCRYNCDMPVTTSPTCIE